MTTIDQYTHEFSCVWEWRGGGVGGSGSKQNTPIQTQAGFKFQNVLRRNNDG